ncbi:hypothetical protein GH714_006747 [Hevea brasiliensis]|uniref:Myb-like domain-containing protein n=1 Tax=Hevea brasiliensis TaxID=3981 RepID=A0A6A6MB81_HEVBR|nr:hypothetical protein GH714_006747 [Hevea brasiliensis]
MDFEPVEVDHAKEKHNDGKAKGNDSNVRPVVGERNQNEHLERMEQGKNNQVGDEQDERIFEEEEQAESLKLNAHCVEEESVVDSALHKSAQVTSETTKASEGNQVREEEKEQIHQGGPETNVTYTGGDAALNVPEMCDSDTEIVAGRQNCGRRPSERGGDQAREGEKEQIHGDAPETNVTYTGAGVALNKPELGYSDTVPMNNQSADVPKKSSFHPHTTSADEAMKQKEEVPAKISTNLPFSHEGRKRFPWKSEEEDKLKEGLQKFSTKNKNIPWRKILEFGRDVFHIATLEPMSDIESQYWSLMRQSIEILKRLQREAFSDLMKLRDRQDKVERTLSFYKASKRSPFQEASTHVRGEIDVLGAILLLGNVDQQHHDALGRAGIKTGIDSRFTFETTIREKDALLAELVGTTKCDDEVSLSALSLAKVSYIANISDWFSAIASPVGAQFRDLGITTNSLNQKKGLTDLSCVGPPLLNQPNGSTIGLKYIRRTCLSTPRGIKLSLLGVHQLRKSSSHHAKLGALTVPMAFLKHHKAPETMVEASAPLSETNTLQTFSTGSIAVKVETGLDENTTISGWIEMNNSNSNPLQWAVNLFDDSEDESGWGMCVSGMMAEGSRKWTHLQAESYLKLNLGNKFSIKPGIAYAVESNARIFALMLRSNWSF